MIDKIIKTVNQNYIRNLESILQQGIEKCDNFNRFDDFIKYKDLSATMHFLNEKVFTIVFEKKNKNSLVEIFYYAINLNESKFNLNAISFGNDNSKVLISNKEVSYYMVIDKSSIDMISFTKDTKLVHNDYLKGLKKINEETDAKIDFMKTLNTIAIHYPNEVFNYVFAGGSLSVEIEEFVELNCDIKFDHNNPRNKELFFNIFDENKTYTRPNNKNTVKL